MEAFTSNAPQLAERLAGTARRIGEPEPALERVRALLAQGEAEVWSSQGAAIGQHWPPPADAERKTDAALLVATGALRNSLTGLGAGEVTELELRFGTDVPYGRFHQYGTSKMPARPFLGVPPDLARRASNLLAQRLEAAT